MAPTIDDTGILYVATGRKYIDLATQSMSFLRKVEPDISITLFLDQMPDNANHPLHRISNLDIHVLEKPQFGFADKITSMGLSPYARSIFLDSDTIPIRPFVSDLAQALHFSPIVALPGMKLNHSWEATGYSAAISQFNTGVIAFNTEELGDFFEIWKERFLEEPNPGHDQPSFRATLLDKKIPCGPLADEFNFMGNGAVSRARILHFTAWRRVQSFYTSPKKFNNLVGMFQRDSASGQFLDFAEAVSLNQTRSAGPAGNFSFWLSGLVRWVLERARRYVFGFGRRAKRLIVRRDNS